jgi:hypothetical protein
VEKAGFKSISSESLERAILLFSIQQKQVPCSFL